VGEIQAGFPSPAEEELRDLISLDEYLITRPESSFLLKVSGDSMAGAGIMPGDLVIVEKGREPQSGDIILAQVDGEWTMKYFSKRGGRILLEAANEKYPPYVRGKNSGWRCHNRRYPEIPSVTAMNETVVQHPFHGRRRSSTWTAMPSSPPARKRSTRS